MAADQLVADGVDVLHTIGGDDTNTAAADLAAFLARNSYPLTVVGTILAALSLCTSFFPVPVENLLKTL